MILRMLPVPRPVVETTTFVNSNKTSVDVRQQQDKKQRDTRLLVHVHR